MGKILNDIFICIRFFYLIGFSIILFSLGKKKYIYIYIYIYLIKYMNVSLTRIILRSSKIVTSHSALASLELSCYDLVIN